MKHHDEILRFSGSNPYTGSWNLNEELGTFSLLWIQVPLLEDRPGTCKPESDERLFC
jgi:hypothetical protein